MKLVMKLLEDFLYNNYDPLDFSFELPDMLVELYDEMLVENKEATEILNDEIPEICAEYERGMRSDAMKEKIRVHYVKVLEKL